MNSMLKNATAQILRKPELLLVQPGKAAAAATSAGFATKSLSESIDPRAQVKGKNQANLTQIRNQYVKTREQLATKPTGNRYVFNGTTAEPVFDMQSNLNLPKLAAGEVLVKVRAATICLSDIHTVCGARIEPTPSVLGHEACVEIVDHKRKNFALKIGDRATFSIADVCGECEYCLRGLSQKCTQLFKYGHSTISNGTGFNGCYASHIVIRKGTKLIKLPEQIDDGLAASINCALATMVNCVDQIPSNVKHRAKKALIQGDGMLGLYGIALLKELGINQVYCSGRQKARESLIQEFGAIPMIDREFESAHNNTFDCIIEVCGQSEAVNEGLRLLKPGGSYIFAGMVHPKTALNITGEQIIRKCLHMAGVHNYDGRHLEAAVRFLSNTLHKYPYEQLVSTRVFGLNELPEAINLAKEKAYPRVCVRP